MISNKPINRPRSSHSMNNSWITRSFKIGRIVYLESDLEYSNFLTVEMDPQIVKFCEHPLEISYEVDGRIEKSIFDMEVEYRDGKNELWEIKYKCELTDMEDKSSIRSQHQIMKQRQWCEGNKIDYRVRTDEEIYQGRNYINNLSYMHHLLLRIDEPKIFSLSKDLLKIIKPIDSICIEHLSDEKNTKAIVMQSVVYMFYKGWISMNIYDKELNYSTEVSYATKKI